MVENAVDEPNVADETADATASDGDVTTITCATDGHTVKFSYMDENGELAGYEADLFVQLMSSFRSMNLNLRSPSSKAFSMVWTPDAISLDLTA